jgi:hypothetical protein
VKYNSKSDKWSVGGDQEIYRPTFVADPLNIAIGWLRFREGQAPERCIFPSLDCEAPKPSEDYKKGFVLALFSEKFFGGVVEFSSTSMHVRNAVSELYDAWEAQRDEHPGELPVVACTGSQRMPSSPVAISRPSRCTSGSGLRRPAPRGYGARAGH